MTADRLMLLAGQSPDAQALLQAAAEGVISGPELEAHLLTHASPAVFAGGMAQALFAAMNLEDAAGRWQAFDGDPASLPEWTAEEVDAEVLHALFVLAAGMQPCRRCLNGWLVDIGHLSPAGECEQHDTVTRSTIPDPRMAEADEEKRAHRWDMHPALVAMDPMWTPDPRGNPFFEELARSYQSRAVAVTLWELAADWHRCELVSELRARTLRNVA